MNRATSKRFVLFLLCVFFLNRVDGETSGNTHILEGLSPTGYVQTVRQAGSFPVIESGQVACVEVDSNDFSGVVRAAKDLRSDLGRVTGRAASIIFGERGLGPNPILIGTLDKNPLLKRLERAGKLDLSGLSGKWETFVVQVVPQPFPGTDQALIICGSDKRGTIYGIYDLCEQIGVSPWYFWADVPPRRHESLYVRPGRFMQGPPSVKYRGIFLNDEAPDLSNWVREKFGAVAGRPDVANYGRGFYTNLFELMLRLRANYLWPAMWNNAFNEDDPENPRLADEYGIVMGTSHQEPMLRAQKEWDRGPGRDYGNWNYNKPEQRPVLEQFWREGIRRNRAFESIITLGLRTENDSGQIIGKELTEQIVGVQRKILAEELDPDLTRVPQMWCLYKEVQGYYEEGLRVPDDVTLLWAEDNWGNLRRLPAAGERSRAGGAGVYYHFDYHGGPRSYQWINANPLPKIWDQLTLAKQYGADRIWIVNVGHFKGYELPMEFFLRLAWDTSRWTNENLDEFTRRWAAREFGEEWAGEIAEIISKATRFNGRRKPELLDPDTYSLVNYREFEKVVSDYQDLYERAERIYKAEPAASRDGFYELVLFPVKACATLNMMYMAAALNQLAASQGRANAADFAARTRELFAAQTNLMAEFNHRFASGKWDHFMDQPYIGYVGWRDPPRNSLQAIHLTDIQAPDTSAMGIAVEGLRTAATNGDLQLPPFDVFNQQVRYVEVFNRGKEPFDFSAHSSPPWIILRGTSGSGGASGRVEKQERLLVSVDWRGAPHGVSQGEINVTGAGGEVIVKLAAFNPAEPTPESLKGFVEGEGCVSMEAEHYTERRSVGEKRWVKIPGYGHTLSGMRAEGPAYAEATPREDSPCLEYQMYLFQAGKLEVESLVGPTLNFLAGRALRYGVSFDEEAPQVVTIVPAGFKAQNGNKEWEQSVIENCRRVKSTHVISAPGYHTLKIWMVDPGVVLEKVIVDAGGVRPSNLGPPESFRSALPKP